MDKIKFGENNIADAENSDAENAEFTQALADAFSDALDCGMLGTVNELTLRKMINNIVQTASSPNSALNENDICGAQGAPKRLGAVMYGMAAGFLLCIAVMAIIGNLAGPTSPVPAPTVQQAQQTKRVDATWFGEVKAIDGRLLFNNETATVHSPIPVGKDIFSSDGSALLHLPTGIDWWINQNTKSKIASLSPEYIRINLKSGENWFKVNPERNGPTLSITTDMGHIDVTGTTFVVNVKSPDVLVPLIEGRVLVTPTSGRQYFVEQGHTISLQDGTQLPVSQEDRNRMHAHLHTLAWEKATQPPATIDVATTAQRSAPNSELRARSNTRRPSSTLSPNASSMTPRQLQSEIQKQRKARNWGQVELLYKRLMRTVPGSETAILSRVSLAELYLTKLHQYTDALRFYNKYIRSGHTALLPEAFYGKCNALKHLDKRNEEQRCLEMLVDRFPSAIQASKANLSLKTLESQ